MGLLATVRVWFELDATTFDIPCGFFKRLTGPVCQPFFSKQMGMVCVRGLQTALELDDIEVQLLLGAIDESSLPEEVAQADLIIQKILCVHNAEVAVEMLNYLLSEYFCANDGCEEQEPSESASWPPPLSTLH